VDRLKVHDVPVEFILNRYTPKLNLATRVLVIDTKDRSFNNETGVRMIICCTSCKIKVARMEGVKNIF